MQLDKALKLPIESKESVIRLIIGGLLYIVPVANLLSSGYAFLLMRDRIFKEFQEELPLWEKWGTLFKYGILTLLISLGYAIIPLVILSLGLGALFLHIFILGFIGITLTVIGGVSFLAAIFFLPMGIILFAIDDEFSTAFSFFRVIDMTIKHIHSYFKAFIILFVMGIILLLLSNIPVIGWIIGMFIGFYLLVEAALLMGDVGKEIIAV